MKKYSAATLLVALFVFCVPSVSADLSMLSDLGVDDIHTDMLGLETPSGANTAGIYQLGDANAAFIDQSEGLDNIAQIWQVGSENFASIEQIGDGNQARIYQSGDLHTATIHQEGTGNQLAVVMLEGSASLAASQIGSNNRITSTLYGSSSLIIEQFGDNNSFQTTLSANSQMVVRQGSP